MTTPDIIILFIVYPLAGILTLFIVAWIFAYVFKINESLERQKIQIHLLYKIAEQAGVNKVELKQIVSDVIAVY